MGLVNDEILTKYHNGRKLLSGEGAPISNLEGYKGQIYLDTVSEAFYMCVIKNSQKEWIRMDGAVADTLATVATTGSYNDLIDIPSFFHTLITEDIVSVVQNDIKGVEPYNIQYGTTDITFNTLTEDDITEGMLFTFVIDSSLIVPSEYRNIRVRFGENGTWHPLMGTTSIIDGSLYFTQTEYRTWIYRTNIRQEGALHLMSDSNSMYDTITQSEIDVGTSTIGKLITPKMLVDTINAKIGDIDTALQELL